LTDGLFGSNAQLAVVQARDDVFDGVLNFSAGSAHRDICAIFPSGVDDVLQLLCHVEKSID
jgi:hypothetical protein